MEKILKKLFLIVLTLLIIFLILSTCYPQQNMMPSAAKEVNSIAKFFYLNRFYNSPINIALWGLLTLFLVISAFTKIIKNTALKLIHIILALIFITVIYEKTVNKRFYLEITEGESLQFADHTPASIQGDSLLIYLDKFEIIRHPGSRMPKAFISHLVINHSDSVKLAVNKPFAYRHYRFYQNAYDRKIICNLYVNGEKYSLTIPDTLKLYNSKFILEEYNHRSKKFKLAINDKQFALEPGERVEIDGRKIFIRPAGSKYVSIIEVAEVKGAGILLVLALIYLIFLLIGYREGDQQ